MDDGPTRKRGRPPGSGVKRVKKRERRKKDDKKANLSEVHEISGDESPQNFPVEKKPISTITDCDWISSDEETERPKRRAIVPRPIVRPIDEDIDNQVLIIPEVEVERELVILLSVGPELLNPKNTAARDVVDREKPMRYKFRLLESQALQIIVEKFLEMDKSTWKIDELCLKQYSLGLVMSNSARDESIADGETISLCLKDNIGKVDEEYIPTTTTTNLAASLPLPEVEEGGVLVIVQSKIYGKTPFKFPLTKDMSKLREAFRQKHNILETAQITFKFEGETLQMSETPQTLELEDEDIIDVIVK